MSGRIELVIGPMFSGKTSRLLDFISEQESLGKSVFVIKANKDDRYAETEIVSHIGRRRTARSCEKLWELEYEVLSYEVIVIDEGHFFEDLEGTVSRWADRGKVVFITALNSGCDRRTFPSIAGLLGKVDELILMEGTCDYCHKAAIFTHRHNWDQPDVWVGGKEKYHSVCRRCYFEKNLRG